MQIYARENPFPKIHFACSIYYELRGTASQRRNIFSADVLPQPFAEMASESPTHPVFARCKTIFPRRAKGCQIVHIYTIIQCRLRVEENECQFFLVRVRPGSKKEEVSLVPCFVGGPHLSWNAVPKHLTMPGNK